MQATAEANNLAAVSNSKAHYVRQMEEVSSLRIDFLTSKWERESFASIFVLNVFALLLSTEHFRNSAKLKHSDLQYAQRGGKVSKCFGMRQKTSN